MKRHWGLFCRKDNGTWHLMKTFTTIEEFATDEEFNHVLEKGLETFRNIFVGWELKAEEIRL